MTAEGKIILEHEDLSAIAYPKQRYTQAMRVGVFFFGDAPEDEIEEPPDEEHHEPPHSSHGQAQQRVAGISTGIWFEGGPKELSKELKRSLARLHVNMGHSPKEELIRILAASGSLSSRVLAGLDALRCGSCISSVYSLHRSKSVWRSPTSRHSVHHEH